MKPLGVPAAQIALCFLITTVLTALFFLPALSDFGHVLLGKGDIQFFMWLFWHYGQSVAHGTEPLYAPEIYYPYGVSLATSTITPFQGALYLLLPTDWGAFGRITFLQILSFILGGIFSFALVHRFTRSFMPSLIGSLIYNFSAFHFEKALNHLNYSMAMPFVALFFICYYDTIEQPKKTRHLAWLALALLLIALNEMTVAVMVGFLVFLDIFYRYLKKAGKSPFSVKNTAMMAAALVISLIVFELFAAIPLPAVIVYTVPPLIFMGTCIFAVLGKDDLMTAEKECGYMLSMALCAIPPLAYMAFLAFQQTYTFPPDSVITNAVLFGVQIGNLVVPSQMQQIGVLFHLMSAPTESGIYLGLPLLALLFLSWFLPKQSDKEGYFRNLGLLCLAFAFPLIYVGNHLVAITPFIAGQLFPLLAFLRDQSRFVMFALLFFSIVAGLLYNRLLAGRRHERIIALALIALLLADRWPALGNLTFDANIPAFYMELSKNQTDSAIFLYPDTNYYTMLQEVYYQTVHGKMISAGVLSRFPSDTKPPFSLYQKIAPKPQDAIAFACDADYDYVVVQKLRCTSGEQCFYGDYDAVPQAELAGIRGALEKELGNAIYEDDTRIVYGTGKCRH